MLMQRLRLLVQLRLIATFLVDAITGGIIYRFLNMAGAEPFFSSRSVIEDCSRADKADAGIDKRGVLICVLG